MRSRAHSLVLRHRLVSLPLGRGEGLALIIRGPFLKPEALAQLVGIHGLLMTRGALRGPALWDSQGPQALLCRPTKHLALRPEECRVLWLLWPSAQACSAACPESALAVPQLSGCNPLSFPRRAPQDQRRTRCSRWVHFHSYRLHSRPMAGAFLGLHTCLQLTFPGSLPLLHQLLVQWKTAPHQASLQILPRLS